MTEPAGNRASGGSFIEAARRRQIVEAAVEVLAEVGYASTTFARIAEQAGISPALISYHFDGKADLLRQVAEHLDDVIDEALTDAIGEPDSHRDAMRRLIEAQVRYFADHTTQIVAMGRLFTEASDDAVNQTLARSHAKALDDLEQMLADGQRDGEYRSFPTRPVAVTLLAALSAVPEELLTRPDTDVGTYATTLADFVDAAIGNGCGS